MREPVRQPVHFAGGVAGLRKVGAVVDADAPSSGANWLGPPPDTPPLLAAHRPADRAGALNDAPGGSDDAFAAVAGLAGLAEAVDRARDAIDRLRGHRVLRRAAEKVASESALRGARASAALEGAGVPLDVLRRTVTAGGRLPAAEEPVVRGALRVAAEVGALRGTWERAPLQALARLHALAAADLVADPQVLGRPEPGAAPRLRALAEALTAPTSAPALVVAAVVHAEIATGGAFPAGGGLVARAAARLTLITRGLDPSAVSVPEVGHVDAGPGAYDQALAAYRAGGDGLRGWVLHCAEAVVLGAREGTAVCEAIQRGAG